MISESNCREEGHTLVELLAAVAVVTLMMALILEVIQGVLQVSRTETSQLEAMSAARRVLDVVSTDLQGIPFSAGATLLVPSVAGTNLLCFVTNRRGDSSSPTGRFLAVRYSRDGSNGIYRSCGTVGFNETNLLTASIQNPVTPPFPLSRGVLAFGGWVQTESTNYSIPSPASSNWACSNAYNGYPVPTGYNALLTQATGFSQGLTNTSRSLVAWIVVTDSNTYGLLNSLDQTRLFQTALGSDPSLWRSQIDAMPIPARAKSCIKVVSKTIPLK